MFSTSLVRRGEGCYACDIELSRVPCPTTTRLVGGGYCCDLCGVSLVTDGTKLAPHVVVWLYKMASRHCIPCNQILRQVPDAIGMCWVCGKSSKMNRALLRITVDSGLTGRRQVVQYTACSEIHYDGLLLQMRSRRMGWCATCGLHHTTAPNSPVVLNVLCYRLRNTAGWLDASAWHTWIATWRDPAAVWERVEYTTGMYLY